MSAAPDRPRLAVVYVQYDRAKYPRALPRLLGMLESLGAGESPLVVVDNAAEGDWAHALSHTVVHLGGDNSGWEFSAFDRGLEWLHRQGHEADVYVLATDALLAYGDDYFDLIDREILDGHLLTTACLGWIDSFGEPCRIFDHDYDAWMRTSLLLMPAAVVERVRPLAWPLDDAEIFGASWRRPFRHEAPLSERLQRLLLGWLTIDPEGADEAADGWHSRFVLGEQTYGFFRSKVKSILREHLLSARLRRLGVPCFDFRAVRKALDGGIGVAGLIAEDPARWQWRGWFGSELSPAPSGPVLVCAAGAVRERAGEALEFLGREVMPLVLQRHAGARLEVVGHELPPALYPLAAAGSLAAGGAVAGATALLLPGPLSDAAPGLAADAAAQGVPVVGTGVGRDAADGLHFLRAERSWEFARACCRLIEDPRLGPAVAAGARELLGVALGASTNGHVPAAVEAAPPAEAGAGPEPQSEPQPESPRETPRPAFPDGHFYSPVIDPAELRERADDLWPAAPPDNPAIDFRPAAQRALLARAARFAGDYDYPEERPDPARGGFTERNGKFEGLDARMWFCLLRHLRPRRVVEIGGGYTTLLAADVNRRFLGGAVAITCIEPYPPEFLRGEVPGLGELIEEKVQDVPLALFERLDGGDVLFIDSSHVSKTGSDVNALYFRILPALRRGVVVHVHDIFFPEDYPRDWVLGEQRSWNEQYIVQALLTFSRGLEVLFGCAYAARRFPELVRQAFGVACGGGSLWLRKTVAPR